MLKYSALPFLCLLSIAVGCSSRNPDEPKVVQAEEDSVLDSDAPEIVLLETAKTLYSNGLFSVARESFASLHANYPLGPYAEFAQIKVGDCYFEAKDYANAAATYHAFLKDHPGTRSADYLTFKIGLSHHYNTKGAGRDVAPVQTGVKYFEDTIRQFPRSPYAASAAFYLEEAQDLIAAHHKQVLEFYKKQGMEAAYADRLAEFEKKYATYLENDSYIIPLEPSKRVRSAAESTPERPRIMETRRRETGVLRASYQSAPATSSFESYERLEGSIRLQSVTCVQNDSAQPRMSFVFDDSATSIAEIRALARHTSEVESTSGEIVIPVPGLAADLRAYSCLKTGDVVVQPDGTIHISSNDSFALMHLEQPNRLVLIRN